MTSERKYGDDTPFGKWVRGQRDLDSHQFSLTLNDADWIFHRYRTSVDGIGTRDLQCMMLVEVKTRNATPSQDQHETLFFMHQMLCHKGRMRRPGKPSVSVWSFGAYVLQLSGLDPQDSRTARWGRFSEHGQLIWASLTSRQQLKDLLRFDITPDTLCSFSARRHHKNKTEWMRQPRGLFDVYVPIVKRS